MSIFDKPDYPGDVKETYPVGTPFTIVGANYKGAGVAEAYPDSPLAVLQTAAIGAGTGPDEIVEVSAWGNLAESVKRMEESELPVAVKIEAHGRAYIFSEPTPEELAAAGG